MYESRACEDVEERKCDQNVKGKKRGDMQGKGDRILERDATGWGEEVERKRDERKWRE